jgi:hypothetical protein
MKTGRGWWALTLGAAITLGLLAAYPLSLGPARWWYRGSRAPDFLYKFYEPIGDAYFDLPEWLASPLGSVYDRYLDWWDPPKYSEER